MFLVRLDDKQVFHFGMAHIQQTASFIQKTNLKFMNPPWIFTTICNNSSQPVTRFCPNVIQ